MGSAEAGGAAPCAGVAPSLSGGRAEDSAWLCPLAGGSKIAADGTGCRESNLAGDLWPGACRDERRLRHPRRRARISRAARLVGGRLHGPRLEPEETDSRD